MGARIADLKTGELKVVNNHLLYQLLMVNKHNHLRLTRIIASLSIVGFRRYAVSLMNFLEKCVAQQQYKDLAKLAQVKWFPYRSDEHTVKIC